MGTFFKIMNRELFDKKPQVFLSENHEMVQALGFYGQDKAFSERVKIRRPGADRHDLDAGFLEDGVELRWELAIEVALEEGRFVFQRGKVSTQIPRFLHHPSGIRFGGQPSDVNATAADVDKEQYKDINQARERPNFFREEIASPHGAGMAGDEIRPGCWRTNSGFTPLARSKQSD
jgi:hypothetical protein